jgi:hypothetical protein
VRHFGAAAGHDEHFLSRVDRLGVEHSELALSLYRDHQLVAYLLGEVELPKSAERVALALGDSGKGPHVIVARNGHFVTCLGKGMRLRPEQPVVSRRRLDQLSERISSLRQLMVDARLRRANGSVGDPTRTTSTSNKSSVSNRL